MKNFIRTSTTLITLITFLCTFVGPYDAFAELDSPSATSSNAPASTEDAYCDSICPSLAGSNGSLLSLSGSGTWSTADDQWCANHGAQTSTSVLPISAPLGSTVPTEACPGVTYYPGDTSCAQVTSQLQHCQYQNSQVEQYCSAYESAKMAGAGEDMVLMLDIAATATCGTACTMEMTGMGVGGPAKTAMNFCNYAAMGAGAAEILVTLTQQSSAMGKIADAALGAAGIVMGLKGMKALSSGKLSCDNDHPKNSLFAYLDSLPSIIPTANATTPGITVAPDANGNMVTTITNPDGTGSSFTEAPLQTSGASGSSVTSPTTSTNNSSCKKEACITAVALAALTGIRYYNNGYGKRTKASACNNIWNLQSSAAAIGGGVAAAGYTSSGGTLGASSSGSSAGASSSGAAGTAAATNCVASGGTIASCSNGQISAATDGGILGSSGLGQLAAPLATQMAQAGTPTSGSGGPGGSMGGAMGGAGDFGNALTKVADTAAANGKELAQVASMGTGGGGGGGGSASDAGGGMGSLFQGAGPTAATKPVEVFRGDGEDSNDIYHSHTDKNIFQIISGRIEKSGSRVNF